MAGSGRSGTAFGVDLYVLYKSGKVHLPVVAQEFAEACNLLTWSSTRENQAFSGSEYFGVDIFQKWTALRDALQNVLADASDGLLLTGEALCVAANEYARADSGAAAELSRLMYEGWLWGNWPNGSLN